MQPTPASTPCFSKVTFPIHMVNSTFLPNTFLSQHTHLSYPHCNSPKNTTTSYICTYVWLYKYCMSNYASIFLSMYMYMYVVKKWPVFRHYNVCFTQNLRLEKENLEAKVEILTNKSSKTTQPGPVLDCIVFHDGHSWRFVFVLTDAKFKFI